MQHIEIHTLETAEDADTADNLGLIEVTEEEYCESCSERVAFDDDGTWIPCSVLLTEVDDDDVVYLLCNECTAPVLDPLDEL